MQRAMAKMLDNGDILIRPKTPVNLDHVETLNGDKELAWLDFELVDKRKARVGQRKLFFALLHDIENHFVVPQDFLKQMFYTQYSIYTAGKDISLSDTTESSVSDANVLLDLVIDFMFEYNVEFKEGYELLPKNESYFVYQCCRHRKCVICGRDNSQIAHYDAVGNRSRKLVDHRGFRYWCLCGNHHQEQHNIGVKAFMNKYHIPPIKLNDEALIKLGVMTKERMSEIDRGMETGSRK